MAVFAPPTIASETITHIGSFELRNTMLTAWLVIVLILIGSLLYYRKSKKLVPSGWQNLVEMFVGGIADFFESVTGDAKQAKRFMPICATIFIYVLIANVLGVFPGFGTIGIWEEHAGHTILVPFFRSANSDVNMTLGIACISVIMSQVYGALALGFSYAGKFFVNPLRNPLGTFVGILELVSEFAKVISFTFRLFGNIFAGEMLLVTMAFLLPFIAPLPFYALELFVAFVQALVFSMLTLVFFKIAVTGHEEHEEHGGGAVEHAT
ncbi:F0F1 ATP synthase subunit A [Candidatus Peregrinibacteria bacterium]|nr:F0F1 ATP synthase subunit A [Candidatus Peregrinibacteria bacterium]